MGLLRRALQKRRGRRDFGPPMGRPRMVPNIPAPIPPLEPFERLPFDDPRNDFMSIQRIERCWCSRHNSNRTCHATSNTLYQYLQFYHNQ